MQTALSAFPAPGQTDNPIRAKKRSDPVPAISSRNKPKTSNFACTKTIWNITLQSLLRLAQKAQAHTNPGPAQTPGPHESYKYGVAAKGRASQVSQHSQSVPRWTNLARTIS